ncbi:hypothetical protein QVG61_07055 [Thiohalobacter sp. IOR34]|uniref:hypothetical protein n=1 Tax=Thiohalobacter sp. IOR34 TaxID=3057176 RepID=UPI0025B0BC33|nr:hypothetical protein [Thiohalobacter sp. IOR34]WJW74283.1 hypothetical protein QVG61_07055 [Thiohalobacter sp. IOR34]
MNALHRPMLLGLVLALLAVLLPGRLQPAGGGDASLAGRGRDGGGHSRPPLRRW